MMYAKQTFSFDPKYLKYILTMVVARPDLVEKGDIKEDCVGRSWTMEPNPERKYKWNLNVSAHLDGVPGQCGMAHLSSWSIYPYNINEYYEKAKESLDYIFEVLAALKYSSVMTTLNGGQDDIKKVLERYGFKTLYTWKNQRSGNECYILIKDVCELQLPTTSTG